jgi:hypothetical protein
LGSFCDLRHRWTKHGLERHKSQPLEVTMIVSSYNTGYFRDSPSLLLLRMVQTTE